MRFRVQVNPTPDTTEATYAAQLRSEVEAMDFESPAQLHTALVDSAAEHMPHMTVGQHNGVINMHGRHGIVVRVRSLS